MKQVYIPSNHINNLLTGDIQVLLDKLELCEAQRKLSDLPRNTINHLIDKGIELCSRLQHGEQTNDIYIECQIFMEFTELYI